MKPLVPIVAAVLAVLVPAGAGAGRDIVVGPGPVAQSVVHGPYRLEIRISPNAAGRRPNTFVVTTKRAGRAVDAAVSFRFDMPAMAMPPLGLRLHRAAPGVARGVGETLTMPGQWQLTMRVAPRDGAAFTIVLVDVVRL